MSRHSAALSSTIQHAWPPELGEKWETECLNTKIPLPAVCMIQRETAFALHLFHIKLSNSNTYKIYNIYRSKHTFVYEGKGPLQKLYDL